ncbi:Hypp2070 [Branchiostoma lanceolatum]|uniref:Hypp2070 protein n=1 Tax=Branchiostoma lanceolatum TaxID=7740 RepID=A0A8K0ENR5_BRALA|nr:Hypp2070 [Branchiostoma lanceolatum]
MQHKVANSIITMILLCCLCAVEGAPSRIPRLNVHNPRTTFLRNMVPRSRRQAESGAQSLQVTAATTGANVTGDVTTTPRQPTLPLNRTHQSASETVNEVDIDEILKTRNVRPVEPVSDHPEGYPEGLLGPQRFMMAVPPPGVAGVVPQLSAKTGDGTDVGIPIKDIAEEAQAEILRTRSGYIRHRSGYIRYKLGYIRYRSGYIRYRSGYIRYRSGYIRYKSGYIRYRSGYIRYKSGYIRYRSGYIQYRSGYIRYKSGYIRYRSGYIRYKSGYTRYRSGYIRYKSGYIRYKSGYIRYRSEYIRYKSGNIRYRSGYIRYKSGYIRYKSGYRRYRSGYRRYRSGSIRYKSGYIRYRSGYIRYKSGYIRYRSGYIRHKSGYIRYRSGYIRHKSGYIRYKSGYRRYRSGYIRYRSGYIRYKSGYIRYRSGYIRYRSGYIRYKSGYIQYRSGYIRYRSGYIRYKSGYIRYRSGYIRYRSEYIRYKSGYIRYRSGYIRYKSGYIRYKSGYRRYRSGYRRYRSGYIRYKSGYIRYRSGYIRYKSGYIRYKSGYRRYRSGYIRHKSGYIRYKSGYIRYKSEYIRYRSGYRRYKSGYIRYKSGYIRYKSGYIRYRSGCIRYRSGYIRYSCYTRSSKELFNILRERGEFNRRYMAVSREDARKFPNVIALSETYGMATCKYIVIRTNDDSRLIQDPSETSRHVDIDLANTVLKEQIKKQIFNDLQELKEPRQASLSQGLAQLLAFPVSSRQVKIDEINTRYVIPEGLAGGIVLPEVLNISRRIIREIGSTEVDYCLERGTVTEDGYKRLCTVCAATTDLGEDYFPRYINEAICSTDTSDRGCFMVQGYGHGTCKQGTFSVSILRRKGQCSPTVRDGTRVYLEEWEVYSQQIRLFCECMINQHSTFAMFV